MQDEKNNTFFLTHLDTEWCDEGFLGTSDRTLKNKISLTVIQDYNNYNWTVVSSLLHCFVVTFTSAISFVPAEAKKSRQHC